MAETTNIAGIVREQDSIKRQFAQSIDVANYFQISTEQITTYYSGTKVDMRGIGSSFVLGDIFYGKLGGGLNPQPYLGDSRPAFTSVLSTNQGSPFLNSGRKQIRDFIVGSS